MIDRKIIICVDEHGRGCKSQNQVDVINYTNYDAGSGKFTVRKVMTPDNCGFCGKSLSVGQ